MNRKEELEQVKGIIKEYYNRGNCGLYDAINIKNDYVISIFQGIYFNLDISFTYSYFEVFGTTPNEFEELSTFYVDLEGGSDENK